MSERLRLEDKVFACLDDVHVASPPDRTGGAFNLLGEQLLAGAGIQLHTGKTRVWNRGGTCLLMWSIWARKFGTQRVSKSWHSDRVAGVRAQHRPAEVTRRGQTLGGLHVGPRSPMRVVDPLAMCPASLPSPSSDTPSKSGNRVRTRARRRDVAGDERLDGWLPCTLEDSG